MGHSFANLSTANMTKYLALLFLAATVLADPEPAPTAAAEASPDAEADPYLLYRSYYGYGCPYVYRRKKRSAEAEPEAVADPKADPYLLYGGYYGHYYGHYGYPYAYWYGKRSADAEPEADA